MSIVGRWALIVGSWALIEANVRTMICTIKLILMIGINCLIDFLIGDQVNQ